MGGNGHQQIPHEGGELGEVGDERLLVFVTVEVEVLHNRDLDIVNGSFGAIDSYS